MRAGWRRPARISFCNQPPDFRRGEKSLEAQGSRGSAVRTRFVSFAGIAAFGFDPVPSGAALDGDWDCFENHYPSWKDSPPAEIVTWMSVAPALRDGWEDSILQALPPSPLL